MKKTIAIVLCSLGLLAAARADNVTLGSTVTLNGTFFSNSAGWPLGTNAAPADLVNGVYQPEQQQWNFNSVWWNGNDGPSNNIVVDLGGLFSITDLKVQADDNDTYRLEYFGTDSLWHDAWDIPAPGGWGLTTSSQNLLTSSLTLNSAITATELRFTATGGDGLYAVSQIEATGTRSVPEATSTLVLLGGVMSLLAFVRRVRSC